MKTWHTVMEVINQQTKDVILVEGMRVIAPTYDAAVKLLEKHNYNYLIITGEIIGEVPIVAGTYEPDWCKMVNYESIKYN